MFEYSCYNKDDENNLPLKKRISRFYPDVNGKLIKSFENNCNSNPAYNLSSSPTTSESSSVDSGFSETLAEPLDLSVRHHPIKNSKQPTNDDKLIKNNQALPTSKLTTSSSSVVCPICNKIYESNARYRAHIRRHESKQSGRYRCIVCSKNFVQRSSLRTHERIHSGEKPYHCMICEQRFGDFSTFTKHRRTHTGEKPYQCPACNRAFSQSGNMHRHLKVVHRPRPNLYQQ